MSVQLDLFQSQRFVANESVATSLKPFRNSCATSMNWLTNNNVLKAEISPSTAAINFTNFCWLKFRVSVSVWSQ